MNKFFLLLAAFLPAQYLAAQSTVTISTPKMSLVIDYGNKASVTSFVVNGKKVIGSDSANPKLLMAGTGAGKVTVTGYERVSPGNYKMMGEPSLDIP